MSALDLMVADGFPVTDHNVIVEARAELAALRAEIEKLRRFDQDHDDQVSAFNQGWGAPSWDAARDMGEDAEMGYAWRHFATLRAEIDSWRTFAARLAEHLHGWDKGFPVPSEPDEQASYRYSLLVRADVVYAQHARMRHALERLRDGPWTLDDVREIAREALRG